MEPLRTVKLSPYRKGQGPTFTLAMATNGATDSRGQTTIAYCLSMRENGFTHLVFIGADFHGSPLHADDSDATVAALLGFLTLRPGDTDPDYFAAYNEAQRAFCEQHAESLANEADRRFGGRS